MPRKPKIPKAGPEDRERLDRLLKDLQRGRLPGLPKPPKAGALDPAALGAPKEWHAIIRYLRTAPFAGLAGVVGAGLGYRECNGEPTGEPAAVILVREKRARGKIPAKHLLPDYVVHDGQRIRIDVQTGFDPYPMFSAAPAVGAFPRATGHCSGSALSIRGGIDPCTGGTLTGIFRDRALTCAHVALGFGFEAFLGNLPASLLWLFQSPSGNDMIASGQVQVGQGLHQLFTVDTNWPILVPSPFALAAGMLGFLFVDGAAGDVAPTAIPAFLPPGATGPGAGAPFTFGPPPINPPTPRATRFGASIRSARIAIPGEGCHKDGQTTGLTNGTVWMPFFQLYLPIPLGFASVLVMFDLVLCRLVIAPGDSGAAVLAADMHYLAQVSLGLPVPAGSVGGGFQPGVACPVDSSDLLSFSIGTPYYLHELLLSVDLS